jgi:hypothetical protein
MRYFIKHINLIGIIRINFSFICIFFIKLFMNCSISRSVTFIVTSIYCIISITTFITSIRWGRTCSLRTRVWADRISWYCSISYCEWVISWVCLFISRNQVRSTQNWIYRVPLDIINDIIHYSFWCVFEEKGFQFIVFISRAFRMFAIKFLLLYEATFWWKTIESLKIVMIDIRVFH